MIAPVSQTTLEYNNVFQHLIESIAKHHVYEDVQLKGANSNYLSEFHYYSKMAPLLSLSSDQTTITPMLKFEPSSTNINSNPFFVDQQKGDYRLSADSPLVGKGRGGNYIGAYPPIIPEQGRETINKPPSFGLSARQLTDLDRKTLGLTSQSGLLVTEVKPGSLAEKLQIKVADVILEVNDTAYNDNEEFKKLITTTPVTTVKVFRGGNVVVLTIPIEF